MDSVAIRKTTRTEKSTNLWQLGSLPILALGTLSGVLGIYWDIAWHIDKGRDSFFSPPHNFIYGAMLIVLITAVYTLVRDRRQSPLHFKLANLSLQPGIIIVALGAAITLFFAPADDLWHRLFGADITLWAPMHLIGLLGLTLATLGGFIATQIEAYLNPRQGRLFKGLSIYFAVMFLAWCMLLLAEYEYGIPVFPMWIGIALLSALPSFILVLMAKLRPFPFAATLTVVGFTVFRFLIAGWLMVSDSRFDWAGETRPAIPLLLLTGVLADLLIQRKVHWALTGSVLALFGFLSNWLLVLALGNPNWYIQALGWGLVGGVILSIMLSRLALSSAKALELKS